MYSRHQIQAVISPPIYTSPSSNISAIKPASSYFISPNIMMCNLNVSICDPVNFSIIYNLNIVKNKQCILLTKFKLLYLRQFTRHLHQTFRPSNQYDYLSQHRILWCEIWNFRYGIKSTFRFLQSEYCEKLTCILVTKFKLLNLHQFISHLHQTFRPSKQYHRL